MKTHQFSSQSPRQQKLWKLFPRLPKIMKNRPWDHRKSNFYKRCFLQYFLCQMHVFQSQTPKFRPTANRKKQPVNRCEKCFCAKVPNTISEWVSKMSKKSKQIKPGPHRVLPCALQCPRIVPGSSQDPPGRQSGGTKHAKWHPRSQKSTKNQ